MTDAVFDFVVVGAGTAGALMANRLSKSGKHSVLLLEAGGKDNYPWIHIPVGYLYCIDNPRTDWRFRTQADPGLNGRSLIYPRGKTLGGCSSINGMIYMRGQARDYDTWAELVGNDEWRWDACLKDFISHESSFRFDAHEPDAFKRPQWHGEKGEWRVERQRLKWDILDAFAQAAVQAGVPATEDFNTGNNEGVGYFEVNQRSGWRWNTSKAFLRPVLGKRSNLSLHTHALVHRLLFETGADGRAHCVGVEYDRAGVREKVRVNKEVVLCAGAIGSPHLLQLSGIGDAHALKSMGITPVHHLPGVGKNLQDHLQIRAVYKVKGAKTLNTLANSVWGKLSIGMQYTFFRKGPMSMAPSQLGAFTKSSPDRPYANIQYHVQPLSLPAFGQPLHDFPAFTASVCNLNPTSRGCVQLQSPDPRQAPAIVTNYLSTDEDKQVAADSLRVTRKIVQQSALARYAPEEFKPGMQYQTNEDLVKLAGDIATTIFHPVGTAKMGKASDPMAVVDAQLRVLGVSGVRVVDASIMPLITSGNTNSPTLMIAEKAARWMVNTYG